jgi:hypothetical protein
MEKKYTKPWKAVIAYIWRTHDLEMHVSLGTGEEKAEKSGRKDGVPVRNRRPEYEFTKRQAAVWARVQESAARIARAEEDGQNRSEKKA